MIQVGASHGERPSRVGNLAGEHASLDSVRLTFVHHGSATTEIDLSRLSQRIATEQSVSVPTSTHVTKEMEVVAS